jgi:hypothetical protein
MKPASGLRRERDATKSDAASLGIGRHWEKTGARALAIPR